MIPGPSQPYADHPALSTDRMECIRELVHRLKEVTSKIEELDAQEERVHGDTSGTRDQLRAINIARIVHVNIQKDLQNKLENVLDSCPAEAAPAGKMEGDGGRERIVHADLTPDGSHRGSATGPSSSSRPGPSLDGEMELIPVRDGRSSLPHPRAEPIHGTRRNPGDDTVLELRTPSPGRSDHRHTVPRDPSSGPATPGIPSSNRSASHSTPPGQAPPSGPVSGTPTREREPQRFRKRDHVLSFKICPVCEARVPANFRRCGRCATRLDNTCPKCGSAIPSGVTFCGKCGSHL